MIFTKTKIKDVFLVDPELRIDERGYFTRIFCVDELKKQGIKFNIVQINQASSMNKGVIRGIHMQKPPKSEDKFVQCLKGSIFDVVVDLRPKSKTYGKWIGQILTAKDKKMMLVPKGCAHAIQALEDDCIVQYPVSEYYSPQHEIGFRWDDPFFNIKWPIKDAIVSEKDKSWPLFQKSNK